ncbi:hypothetical protein BT63DRAFT_427586 [Microthyrium microscopicum]|uniref:CUE domain-containing protein n=1 Tax=Microthyrium microscopicum TaxID=703497 RepID=A0A6A6U6W7_9PEZI|nr:hypothetical protein BT63DRAFT_427586 [Microthyrium microscopicum]
MMAGLPAPAPFPPPSIRLHVAPAEWAACLEGWLMLATSYLRLSSVDFQKTITEHGDGVMIFLASYVHEHSSQPAASLLDSTASKSLHKTVYFLCHRVLSLSNIPPVLLQCRFLAELGRTFQGVSSLKTLLSSVWTNNSDDLEKDAQSVKNALIKKLDFGATKAVEEDLKVITPLLFLCPASANFFAIGSDLFDSLTTVFPSVSEEAQQAITAFSYILLTSLISIPKPNISLLSDHLYSLKVNAKLFQSQKKPSLLVSLASNTPMIHRLGSMNASESDPDQEGPSFSRDLSAGLLEFQTQPTFGKKKSKSKGKGKAHAAATDALDTVHIHRMSMITQIQDLFPDLGSGFIAKLFDEYNEDVEQVTAHLLDESLPPHLANADRSEQLESAIHEPHQPASILDPRSTPPLSRRNKFDNDEFDNLAVDASRLHIGKSDADLTADDLISAPTNNKAAILAALAAFDADDDERDDTYDDTDVGGTVDTSVDTADRPDPSSAPVDNSAERLLYTTWKSDASVFARDYGTRHSVRRSNLKQQTGWTDEALEGWAIMLTREPARQRVLERRFGDLWRGEQRVVVRTAWRDEEEGDGSDSTARGGHRGRGGRGGFRGRGGNVAGPPDDKGTQRARRGKEVRGSNRRDGRAKKMARGMGP